MPTLRELPKYEKKAEKRKILEKAVFEHKGTKRPLSFEENVLFLLKSIDMNSGKYKGEKLELSNAEKKEIAFLIKKNPEKFIEITKPRLEIIFKSFGSDAKFFAEYLGKDVEYFVKSLDKNIKYFITGLGNNISYFVEGMGKNIEFLQRFK